MAHKGAALNYLDLACLMNLISPLIVFIFLDLQLNFILFTLSEISPFILLSLKIYFVS